MPVSATPGRKTDSTGPYSQLAHSGQNRKDQRQTRPRRTRPRQEQPCQAEPVPAKPSRALNGSAGLGPLCRALPKRTRPGRPGIGGARPRWSRSGRVLAAHSRTGNNRARGSGRDSPGRARFRRVGPGGTRLSSARPGQLPKSAWLDSAQTESAQPGSFSPNRPSRTRPGSTAPSRERSQWTPNSARTDQPRQTRPARIRPGPGPPGRNSRGPAQTGRIG